MQFLIHYKIARYFHLALVQFNGNITVLCAHMVPPVVHRLNIRQRRLAREKLSARWWHISHKQN